MSERARHRAGADAIRRELIREGLAAICEEMAVSVIRTSHSETVKSAMDFSTALCDAKGEIIAQGVTLPNQLGALPDAVAAVLREFGGTLVPGDVVMVNDPFAGRHAPARHLRGQAGLPRATGWSAIVATVAHHADLGGLGAGQHVAVRRGVLPGGPAHPAAPALRGRRARARRVRAASRQHPRARHRARRHGRAARRLRHRRDRAAAAHRAPRRGRLRRPGRAPARLHRGADPARRSGRSRRARTASPTTSTTTASTRVRSPIAVAVTIADGVGDDGLRGLRRRRSRRRSTARCRSRSRTRTPRCGRCSARTSRTTPASSGRSRSRRRSGSIVNCVLPAATGTRGLTGFRVLDAVFGALAAGRPGSGRGRVGWRPVAGHDRRRAAGRRAVLGRRAAVGRVGRPGRSRGPGRRPEPRRQRQQHPGRDARGGRPGPGRAVRLRAATPVARAGIAAACRSSASTRSSATRCSASGPIASGSCRTGSARASRGRRPANRARRPAARSARLPSKFSRPVAAGDRFHHRTAGAGGWGDALEREPDAVAADVRNGILSRERALAAYGVVVSADGRELDEAATDGRACDAGGRHGPRRPHGRAADAARRADRRPRRMTPRPPDPRRPGASTARGGPSVLGRRRGSRTAGSSPSGALRRSPTATRRRSWTPRGLVVAPGFIDIHSHADVTVLADPRARSAVAQGVTTIVVGNCGHSPAPLPIPAALPDLTFGSPDGLRRRLDDVRRIPRRRRGRPPGGQRRIARRAQRAPGRGPRPVAARGDRRGASQAMVGELDRGDRRGRVRAVVGLEYPLGARATTDELVRLAGPPRPPRRPRRDPHPRPRLPGRRGIRRGVRRSPSGAAPPLQISHIAPRRGAPDGALADVLERIDRAPRGRASTSRATSTPATTASPSWSRCCRRRPRPSGPTSCSASCATRRARARVPRLPRADPQARADGRVGPAGAVRGAGVARAGRQGLRDDRPRARPAPARRDDGHPARGR